MQRAVSSLCFSSPSDLLVSAFSAYYVYQCVYLSWDWDACKACVY